MVKDFTEIQKQIITTDKAHVLVSSAAASGKTQTLVGRIKYLLENGELLFLNTYTINYTNKLQPNSNFL